MRKGCFSVSSRTGCLFYLCTEQTLSAKAGVSPNDLHRACCVSHNKLKNLANAHAMLYHYSVTGYYSPAMQPPHHNAKMFRIQAPYVCTTLKKTNTFYSFLLKILSPPLTTGLPLSSVRVLPPVFFFYGHLSRTLWNYSRLL